MTNNQLTDEQIAQWLGDACMVIGDRFATVDELSAAKAIRALAVELQERRKAEMGSEPVAWTSETALSDVACEETSMIGQEGVVGSIPLYRHAQQPVVPDESYQQLSELYHAQEKRLFKIAQRIKGPVFDKYSHSPSQAIDVLEGAIFGENDACRAAMLQAGNDVTNGKPLTITLPDITSKAFWSGTGKSETFLPESYKRWVKETIERDCIIARIDVEVK